MAGIEVLPWSMQPERDVLAEEREIQIRGEYGHPPSIRDRANQEIGVGSLNTMSPTQIEEPRGAFMIFADDVEIGESP